MEDTLPRANDYKKRDDKMGITYDSSGNPTIEKPKTYDEWYKHYEKQFGAGATGSIKMMANRFSKWDNKRYDVMNEFKNDWEKEGKKGGFEDYKNTRQIMNAKKQIADEGAKKAEAKKQEYEGWKAYEAKKKEWNDEMRRRRDHPLAKVVDGLTKIGDFVVKTPLVNGLVGGMYKQFAPPGSEYYKGK